jgi:predicted enzyme related to lactoylglutathione lyase
MPRPVHFELTADDPARAIRFYESVFGWSIEKWDGPMPYWNIRTGEGPGIDGGLGLRSPGLSGTTAVMQVDSVDAATTKVSAAGGRIAVPKMAVPTVGWLAYAHDTEGNLFGMMQFDAAAG